MNFIKHVVLKTPEAICPILFENDLPAWIQQDPEQNPIKKFWIPAGAAEYALYENSHPSAFKVVYWIYEDEVVALVRDDNKKTFLVNNRFKTQKEKDEFFIDLEQRVDKNTKKVRMNISFNTPLSVIENLLYVSGFSDGAARIEFPNKKFKSDPSVGHLIEIHLPHVTEPPAIEKMKVDLKLISDYFSEKDFVTIQNRMTNTKSEPNKEHGSDMKNHGSDVKILGEALKVAVNAYYRATS